MILKPVARHPIPLLAAAVILFSLIACGQAQELAGSADVAATRPVPPTPRTTPIQTPTPTHAPSGAVPGLAEALTTVTAIHLEDDWNGLATIYLQEAHFDLTRRGDTFSGTARFTVADPRRSAECPIAIPPDVMRSFLDLLAKTPARLDRYIPRIDHTDDYPKLLITLTTDRGPVSFASQSQGTYHTPWGLSFANRGYVVESWEPNSAFMLLKPYLNYKARDLLISEAQRRGSPTAPAAMTPCME